MKKYLLFAFLSCGLFAFNNAGAQSFSTQSPTDTVEATYGGTGSTSLDIYNNIKATTGSVTIKWHVTYVNLNGWGTDGICDNYQCYGSGTTVFSGAPRVSHAYNSNAYSLFHVTFIADNAAVGNSAVITVMLEDTVNNYSKSITFIANKTAPTGISNMNTTDDAIRLYPNPAHEAVNVTFDAAMDVRSVAVYNLIGKAVSVFKTNGTSARLDLSDVPAGIYLLRMANSNGQIVATRKFSHL